MITVNNICAGYGAGDVIRNIGFRVEKGESLCVLGPNGCGKSTLLKAIARIIEYRGTITLEEENISRIPRKNFAQKIAMLGQTSQVFFPYTVYETVAMGRYAWSQGILKNLSAQDGAIIDDIIDKLDIRGIQNRMIDELSGGTLQRVFLARTLAQTPEVILLDEPTNHLDLKYQLELLSFLQTWIREKGKTLICVFHDINLARQFGDRAIIMDNGQIAAVGTIAETLNSETLQKVYGIDIRSFMLDSLEKWK